MIHSDVIKKYGNWFDPEFTAIEDADLFIRISRNWDLAFIPNVLCKYRMHEDALSYSNPIIFRKEEELMVEKFKLLYPEFKDLYKEKLRGQIRRDHAVVEWKLGNNVTARKIIRPIVFKKTNYFITYLLMFFPYKFFHAFRILISNRAISNY